MRSPRGRTALARGAALAALLLVAAHAAGAQVQGPPHEPQLEFTIYGGLSEGSSLWRIPAQAVQVAGSSQQDTLALGRQLRPGLVAGLVVTYYVTPNFGWTGDVGLFSIGSEQRCDSTGAYKPDAQNENQQTCISAQGQHIGTNMVGLLAGFTYRALPHAAVQPFVRVTGGVGLLGNASFIETSGFAVLPADPVCSVGCTVTLLHETAPHDVTWIVNVATGVSIVMTPAYRLRFEVRDVITSLTAAQGPRNPLDNSSEPPRGSVVKHLPTFLFGFDIVLERRHTRRY
jgi:hypothetical protein